MGRLTLAATCLLTNMFGMWQAVIGMVYGGGNWDAVSTKQRQDNGVKIKYEQKIQMAVGPSTQVTENWYYDSLIFTRTKTKQSGWILESKTANKMIAILNN